MKFLIVAAHPDDELLGAGATIMALKRKGHSFDLCIMSEKAEQRMVDIKDNDIISETSYVCKQLDIDALYSANFPNIQMNLTPHIELVKFIERAIINSKASIVITHHPSDTNNDHYQTSMACQEAFRIYQRRNENAVNEMWYMEIPSSTDWSLNTSTNRFTPNLFIDIQPNELKRKIELLSHYSGALRESPHPRSDKNISALASFRGGQSGSEYAEAFECVFRKYNTDK